MMSERPRRKIVLASGNAGKIREIQALLPDCLIVPQTELGVDECEETAGTFVENALLKARNAAQQTGLPAIADDSGLMVDALGGAPGVWSARYAGLGATDPENLEKLLHALADVPEESRGARFICVMAFLRHAQDPCPIIAQGAWEGRILTHSVGDNGFGYDPVFWVPDRQCSSAQLPAEVKNALSHRGRAVRQLASLLASF
jgi:XTP/dITP diphosphohydrolase